MNNVEHIREFNKQVSVTVQVSRGEIEALRRETIKRFTDATAKEKDSDKKPATKALESILKYSESEMDACVVRLALKQIAMKRVEKFFQDRRPAWYTRCYYNIKRKIKQKFYYIRMLLTPGALKQREDFLNFYE